ncbi:hypothetical protein GMST_01040 [Geomonas silvestris]|uniref:PEP-CTERM system associated protein n=1 Tax=Geomonas silvestris TaxID=2740184 RepID=A0A6V8MDM3_9BACT|nr:TIGR03016 family PEP-CTERM system-associated outer membrane protein [Geomonas silvestris]GFO57779.1 hypothetical protein GMST_01040 [Geomonas silvestris]
MAPIHPAVRFLFSLGLLAAATPCTWAADFQFAPALTVSEEYNDNVLGTEGAKLTDYITRVQPGLGLVYQGPKFKGDLRYSFDYRTYARATRKDETYHYLNLHGSADLKEFLYLDISDSLSRVSLDSRRPDVITESSFLNQVTQNVASGSPYLVWHPVDKGVLRTGYRFTDTSYWGGGTVEKRSHLLFTDLTHQTSERLGLNAGYTYARVRTSLGGYQQHDVTAGARYEYAAKSFLFGGLGNSWQELNGGDEVSSLTWNAGLTHTFGQAVATVETRVSFIEDPQSISTKETGYYASLSRTLEHGALALGASYSEDREMRTGVLRKKGALNASGSYEVSPHLMANLALTADRVNRVSLDDLPYHLNANAGLSYAFNYGLTLALGYSYVEYRKSIDDVSGARQTNRVSLELRQVLPK